MTAGRAFGDWKSRRKICGRRQVKKEKPPLEEGGKLVEIKRERKCEELLRV